MFALILEAVRGRPRSWKQGPLKLWGTDTQISALFTPPSSPAREGRDGGERERRAGGREGGREGKRLSSIQGKFLNSEIKVLN
jgi:hypothetical protein